MWSRANTQPSDGSHRRGLTGWCSYVNTTAFYPCDSSMFFGQGVQFLQNYIALNDGSSQAQGILAPAVTCKSPEWVLESATPWAWRHQGRSRGTCLASTGMQSDIDDNGKWRLKITIHLHSFAETLVFWWGGGWCLLFDWHQGHFSG